MSRIKLAFAVSVIIALCIVSTSAQDINSNAGTSAFPFLKINVGARPVAMGGAFTGLANDESSLYYNPAGIANFENTRYILGYHNYFVDMQSGFVGFITPFGDSKAIAGYVSYLNYGDMTETDNLGNVLGEFSGGDMLIGLTFAMAQSHSFQFGGSAKFIYQKLQEYSATGIAFDLGARYVSSRERYTAGIMIQNLGTQLSTLGEDDKESLPLTFRAGASARPRGVDLLFVGDIILPTDNDLDIAVGAEYYDLKPFYARLGWNTFGSNYRTTDSDDSWAGLSMGFGFDISDLGFIKNTQISYSYSPAAELGESHRITLTGGR